ncbi:MAG: hypothetical protein ACTTIO_05455 [Candidatus Fimenecus sp.]
MMNSNFKILTKEEFLKKLKAIKKKLKELKDEKTPPSNDEGGSI